MGVAERQEQGDEEKETWSCIMWYVMGMSNLRTYVDPVSTKPSAAQVAQLNNFGRVFKLPSSATSTPTPTNAIIEILGKS